MTRPLSLVAIVGSLRQQSFNRAVFRAAVELGSGELALTIAELDLREVPLYNGDVEAAGDPPAVTALKEGVTASDGLIIFTPEYNLSVPAVTKNAIDWLSRMPGESALTTATVGVVAGTVGNHEAAGVQSHLSHTLNRIAGHFHPETIGLGSLRHGVTDGDLTDPEARARLATWLEGFRTHAAEVAAS